MKKIYKIIQILKIIFYALIILLIILSGYYIIKRIKDKQNPSKIFGYYIVEVAPGSGSMYNPDDEYKDITLSPGDLLFIKPLKDEEYKIGMTITFYDENKNITTHQIIRFENDLIITKGINKNNTEDKPITYQQIIGKVDHVWHSFRKTANFFISPKGIIITIFTIFAINFAFEFLDKKLKVK